MERENNFNELNQVYDECLIENSECNTNLESLSHDYNILVNLDSENSTAIVEYIEDIEEQDEEENKKALNIWAISLGVVSVILLIINLV